MPDATTKPTKGATISVVTIHYHRSCPRPGCDGTAGGSAPTDGECIYLSKPSATGEPGRAPCGQPYTKAEWVRADYSRTGRVAKVEKAAHSGTTFVYLTEPGLRGQLALAWLDSTVASWELV